jgi:cellulase
MASATWYSDNYGQHNPVFSKDVNTNNIACHVNATPGSLVVQVKAGDTVELTWETPEGGPWRPTHEGPVIDYLASCGGKDCRDASADQLEFFKIAESGMFQSPHKTPNGKGSFGRWGTDLLRDANNTWNVTIPASLSGPHVLRTELFALMGAGHEGHAQMFPQCINLDIEAATSSEVAVHPCESGADCRLGRDLYNETDPGIDISIHGAISQYHCPGPAVWHGAKKVATASKGDDTKTSDSMGRSSRNWFSHKGWLPHGHVGSMSRHRAKL